MKKILSILLILFCLKSFSQVGTPPGFTTVNSRYDWLEGKFKNTLHFPAGAATPTLYGGWTGAGAPYWDSVGKKLRIWDGTYFRMYPDSVYNIADSSIVVQYGTRKDTLKQKTVGGGGGSTLTINSPLTGTSYNGSAPVSIGINVKTINSFDTVGGTGNIRTRVEGFNTIVDTTGGGYPGFPYADVLGDRVLFAWKASSTHAGSGAMMLGRSQDGNVSIDSTWQLNVSGLKSGTNLAFGVVKSGAFKNRVIIQYQDAGVSDSIIHVAYSDDTMKTWTAGTDIVENIHSAVFGRIRQIQSDTIVSWRYSVGASIDSSFLHYSVDGGATWPAFSTVAKSATLNFDESDLCYLGNAKIIAIIREESNHRPYQFTSTDDGHTWTQVGDLGGILFATTMAPMFVEKWNNKLWLLSNFRDGAGNNSVWFYCNGLESLVFTDVTKWSKKSPTYHPLNDDLGNATLGIENGYTVPFQFAGRLMVVGYDNSIFQKTIGTAMVRSFTIPIAANGNFVKVYRGNANGNQSISASTNTLVSYTDIDMNDDITFNTDSGFVIFKRDGWYDFKATATFDTTTSLTAGTKRKMYAQVGGQAYTLSPFAQSQVLSKCTLPNTGWNDFDFTRMEVGGVYYFRKGEQLKIFVFQDSGGSLNLINTTQTDRQSTLVLKRIDQ